MAIPLSEYHHHLRQAITALDTASQSDETESAAAYGVRDAETVRGVRTLLPPTEKVEWKDETFDVDTAIMIALCATIRAR